MIAVHHFVSCMVLKGPVLIPSVSNKFCVLELSEDIVVGGPAGEAQAL